MGAKNKVIAGDYKGKMVICALGNVSISTSLIKSVAINKYTIEGYELVTDEHRKSAASGIVRGIVGGTLLGPVGLLAGLSAKNKSTYTVAISFCDGKQSLIEIDGKIYKALIKSCF